MSAVLAAIGSVTGGAYLSLFVVTPASAEVVVETAVGADVPERTTRFPLEQDTSPTLPGRDVVEIDVRFPALPDLAAYVRTLLDRAFDAGAELAWFGFEGSFSFDHVLTDEVARLVYGVTSAATGTRLALDDNTLHSAPWISTLRQARRAVFEATE